MKIGVVVARGSSRPAGCTATRIPNRQSGTASAPSMGKLLTTRAGDTALWQSVFRMLCPWLRHLWAASPPEVANLQTNPNAAAAACRQHPTPQTAKSCQVQRQASPFLLRSSRRDRAGFNPGGGEQQAERFVRDKRVLVLAFAAASNERRLRRPRPPQSPHPTHHRTAGRPPPASAAPFVACAAAPLAPPSAAPGACRCRLRSPRPTLTVCVDRARAMQTPSSWLGSVMADRRRCCRR